MFPRYFKVQEAGQRLPLLRKIVQDILKKGTALRTLLQNSNVREKASECLTLQEEIEALMKELEDLGCFYKDWNFEIGLVDFPALIQGEEVFLCWRSDEKNIRWYHPVEEGYAGRKLIPENLLEE